MKFELRNFYMALLVSLIVKSFPDLCSTTKLRMT